MQYDQDLDEQEADPFYALKFNPLPQPTIPTSQPQEFSAEPDGKRTSALGNTQYLPKPNPNEHEETSAANNETDIKQQNTDGKVGNIRYSVLDELGSPNDSGRYRHNDKFTLKNNAASANRNSKGDLDQ